MITDRNAFTALCQLNNSCVLLTSSNGTSLGVWGGSAFDIPTTTYSIVVGEWFGFALSLSGADEKLVIRRRAGFVEATGTGAAASDVDTLMLGSDVDSEAYAGELDLVRLYDRVLTTREALQELDHGTVLDRRGLVADWRLVNAQRWDHTGQGRHLVSGGGTIVGGLASPMAKSPRLVPDLIAEIGGGGAPAFGPRRLLMGVGR